MKLASATLLLALVSLTARAAEITIEKTPSGGAIVKAGGQFFTEFVVDQANKTYLWPINGPTGTVMTRLYPMQKVEGEQHDHPHHRGLCFGHENIAGYDTWAERSTFGEKASGKTSERVQHLGAIKHREITEIKNGETGVLATKADYVDAAGKKTHEEERTMTFRADADTRTIDVDITLIASEGDILVDDKKDSGLSIRVPSEMAVDIEPKKKGTGHIISSEGLKDADAWGKRAKWVDYYGTVKGDAVGVAMLNHPSSFRYPTPWHVRTYGLFTANPFGLQSLDKASETGAFTLKKGDKITLRHRFIFHKGDEKAAKIAEAFEAYAKEK